MAEEVASVDVANHELFAALRHPGCPMCRVLAAADRHAVESFVAEGHRNRAVREAFVNDAGFCRHHALALLAALEDAGTGAVIADLYGKVAERDIASLEHQSGRFGRRPRPFPMLPESTGCHLCARYAAAERRHANFLCGLLSDGRARRRYRESDGLCRRHVNLVASEARKQRGLSPVADWLLQEWRARLVQLRQTLAEYDRNRDYRFAAERSPEEQRSWRDVIWVYAGGTNER